MNTIELVATSLTEATANAAAQLGVSVDDVKIEVLEETKGLFGKPGKVTVKAWAEAKEEASAEPAKEVKAKKPAAKKAEPKAKPAKAEAKPAKEEVKAEESSDSDEESSAESATVEASQDDAKTLIGYLTTLMEAGNLDIDVTCTEVNGRYVNINLDGADAGYLVGRRGEVINNLQYLLNVVAARQLQNGVRVVLECDNYREKRGEFLTKMAMDIAEQVKSRGEEAVLDALPAFERRVIHQALVDFDGVSTYSEGEEPGRRVVIAPSA